MPVTTPNSYVERFNDLDHFSHVLTHLFVPALKEVELAVIPPSVQGAELIHGEIIKNLEQADLVLCDLSSLNPNVFFELGIRTSLDRPVALVKDNLTAQIPFDLNAINTLTYDSSLVPWKLDAEVTRLVEYLRNIVESGSSGNSMWNYFGLTKRGTPAEVKGDPIQAKLDFLISEFEKIQPAGTRSGRDRDSRVTDLFREMVRYILSQHGIPNDFSTSMDHSSKSAQIYIIESDNSAEFSDVLIEKLRREMQAYSGYKVSVSLAPF
jgi:hypothetical protein